MYKASVTRGEHSTSASPLGRAAYGQSTNNHAAKHIYVDVKNDRGDSKIDYIINAKIALLKFREVYVNSSLPTCIYIARGGAFFQLSPYTGIAAPLINFASGLHRNRMT